MSFTRTPQTTPLIKARAAFNCGILFEQGRAEITPLMQDLLGQVCEPWLGVLMRADAPVASALIEGHASSEWRAGSSPDEAHLNNLALPQARSQAVLDACLRIVRSGEVRDWAHAHLAAVGYSSARPVLLRGIEDPARSRRVVFSLRIDHSRLLQDVASDVGLDAPVR